MQADPLSGDGKDALRAIGWRRFENVVRYDIPQLLERRNGRGALALWRWAAPVGAQFLLLQLLL